MITQNFKEKKYNKYLIYYLQHRNFYLFIYNIYVNYMLH